MKRKTKMVLNVIIIILIVLCVSLLAVFINHKIKTKEEEAMLEPIGQLVEVDERNMCVYTEGEGEKTIVFLSGGGTPSPILDFKSLYTQLTDEYKIAVVEKFGYGFSNDYGRSRDIDTILEDTREALSKVGVEAPYILCPHSMSGLESIYWAQKYPDEVLAIVGLDMALPEDYAELKISTGIYKFEQALCKMGLIRLISKSSINTAYAESILTENEKSIIMAIYSKCLISEALINEVEAAKDNAKKVGNGNAPYMPVLMFISNGEGVGIDKEVWKSTAQNYAEQLENGEYIQLDCPHNVHNIEYEKIAEEMKRFLKIL